MAYGSFILSKVCDDNSVKELRKYGIERADFATETERQAYEYVVNYAEANGDQAPSYATLIAEVPAFDDAYVPDVTDNMFVLAQGIKAERQEREFVAIMNDLAREHEKGNGKNLLEQLHKRSQEAIMGTSVRSRTGTSAKEDTAKVETEYDRRKEGESNRIWASHFPSINREIGGYASANMYTWYGRSGRGKSIMVLEEIVKAAQDGATCLVWSLEMSWYEVMVRIYVSLSGRLGLRQVTFDDAGQVAAGFDSRAIRHGDLTPEFEAEFRSFLANIDAHLKGDIIVRATDDEGFTDRSAAELRKNIEEYEADVVMIDPFYLMNYERNEDKTPGGAATKTSQKLRGMAGYTQTVMHVITQADEETEQQNDEGERELSVPTRKDIMKTKAVLQDAASVFGIDTVKGHGEISLGKGRDGGEGVSLELLYYPGVGVVREISAEEALVKQF